MGACWAVRPDRASEGQAWRGDLSGEENGETSGQANVALDEARGECQLSAQTTVSCRNRFRQIETPT